jgi:hypothetical protein
VEIRVQDSASIRLKHSFSKQHLAAADYFAREAEAVEMAAAAQPDAVAHRAYVTGGIISAVAALESSINELFLEAADRNPHTLPGVPEAVLSRMAGLWPHIERNALLDKYQVALTLADKPRLDRGDAEYQHATSVVKLRDALVHYKPEWDDEAEVHAQLEKRLQSKFSGNPFAPPGSLWFPHVCLGSGCAKWCVKVVTDFSGEFCRSLSIPARF